MDASRDVNGWTPGQMRADMKAQGSLADWQTTHESHRVSTDEVAPMLRVHTCSCGATFREWHKLSGIGYNP